MDIYFEKTKDGKRKYQSILDYQNDIEKLKYIEEKCCKYVCLCVNKRILRKVIEYFQPDFLNLCIPAEIEIIKINKCKKLYKIIVYDTEDLETLNDLNPFKYKCRFLGKNDSVMIYY